MIFLILFVKIMFNTVNFKTANDIKQVVQTQEFRNVYNYMAEQKNWKIHSNLCNVFCLVNNYDMSVEGNFLRLDFDNSLFTESLFTKLDPNTKKMMWYTPNIFDYLKSIVKSIELYN